MEAVTLRSKLRSKISSAVIIAGLTILSAIPASASQTSIERTIAQKNAEYVNAFIRQDAAAIAATYAPEGVYVGAGGRTVKGRAAIESMMRAAFAKERLVSGTCRTDRVDVTAGEAWETGHCDYVVSSHGKTTKSGGRYLTLWRIDPSGDMTILVDVNG
jgi:uncharacterized protein (TIGR02246 family)